MTFVPQPLQELADQLNSGTPEVRVSVRVLLNWFGAQKRGYYVVRSIRSAFAHLGIATNPSFETAWIEEKLSLRKLPASSTQNPPAINLEAPSRSDSLTGPDRDGQGDTLEDPTHRIGKLDAANRPPKSVSPNSDLAVAITIMLAHDYSQLPVISGKATVKGMISWRSIGRARHFGKTINSVMDCVEAHHEVHENASLFAALPTIVEHESVLVRSSTNEIKGIVTTADLSLQFRTLAEPFLLLGEAENHIRGMLDRCYTLDVLKAAKDPTDVEREVRNASDLTFGEYARLLENPEHWSKLKLPLDRSVFVESLEDVRRVRNDVMHFDPEGIQDADVLVLRRFANLVHGLAQDRLI